MSDIKRVFKSRFIGGKIIEADFSQLEIYALAFLSNDAILKDDLLSGKDLHCVSGALLTGESYLGFYTRYKSGDETAVLSRKLAKQLSFQLQYGAGATSMAKKNGVSKKTAQAFIAAYYNRYKGVKEYHEALMSIVRSNRIPSDKHTPRGDPAGVSKYHSITGRVYTFYEQDNPYCGPPNFSPTQVKNYPVQGFATGDIVPLVLGHVQERIFKEGLGEHLLIINTIHDSILFDLRPTLSLFNAIKLIKEVMESAPKLLKSYFNIDFDMPLNVGIKYGDNWLEVKEYDGTS